MLAGLQAAFARMGIHSTLARSHRLVLRYAEAPLSSSGLTDPCLHVFTPGGVRKVTTDGTAYRLDDREDYEASNPAAAAARLLALAPA